MTHRDPESLCVSMRNLEGTFASSFRSRQVMKSYSFNPWMWTDMRSFMNLRDLEDWVVFVVVVVVVVVTYSISEFVNRKHTMTPIPHKAAPLGRLAVRKRSQIPGDEPDHEDQ